jgi:hypothetical protein
LKLSETNQITDEKKTQNFLMEHKALKGYNIIRRGEAPSEINVGNKALKGRNKFLKPFK